MVLRLKNHVLRQIKTNIVKYCKKKSTYSQSDCQHANFLENKSVCSWKTSKMTTTLFWGQDSVFRGLTLALLINLMQLQLHPSSQTTSSLLLPPKLGTAAKTIAREQKPWAADPPPTQFCDLSSRRDPKCLSSGGRWAMDSVDFRLPMTCTS